MTAEELIAHFNRVYGLNPWPKTYTVDHVTYANCCQYVFNQLENYDGFDVYLISLSKNRGLMFKNVELILVKL